MISRIYSKVITFIKENYIFLLSLIIFNFVITYPVPYTIESTGGILNASDRFNISNTDSKKGNFYLAYVSEIEGNVLTYLLSYVVPDWDLVKNSELKYDNETIEEANFSNKILLDDANQNAVFDAYNYAHKEINITGQSNYIIYVDSKAKTDLKTGDQILSVNNTKINNIEKYKELVKNSNEGEILTIKVKDSTGKTQNRTATVYTQDNEHITGIYVDIIYKFKTDPRISFHFKESESGPSGGLITTLSIYSKITNQDLTKGYKIVGTGTIDDKGNVGEISGVKYKLKGAANEKADIFLAPSGSNYKEAVKLQKKNNYKIKIVEIKTFEDAVKYLESLKSK